MDFDEWDWEDIDRRVETGTFIVTQDNAVTQQPINVENAENMKNDKVVSNGNRDSTCYVDNIIDLSVDDNLPKSNQPNVQQKESNYSSHTRNFFSGSTCSGYQWQHNNNINQNFSKNQFASNNNSFNNSGKKFGISGDSVVEFNVNKQLSTIQTSVFNNPIVDMDVGGQSLKCNKVIFDGNNQLDNNNSNNLNYSNKNIQLQQGCNTGNDDFSENIFQSCTNTVNMMGKNIAQINKEVAYFDEQRQCQYNNDFDNYQQHLQNDDFRDQQQHQQYDDFGDQQQHQQNDDISDDFADFNTQELIDQDQDTENEVVFDGVQQFQREVQNCTLNSENLTNLQDDFDDFNEGQWFQQEDQNCALNAENQTNLQDQEYGGDTQFYNQQQYLLTCPTTTKGIKIHSERAKYWVYPSQVAKREYQFNIVQAAIFNNTLVCLPTGLGKTLIAAVVMYNFYRWFPEGKIVFTAPTRPLVDQQLHACTAMLGIPSDKVAEMTGSKQPESRQELWNKAQVFFCTPQTFDNDIRKGICPVAKIVCLTVDECHRAKGDAAVVKAIKFMQEFNIKFRILGLSATPGSSKEAIQEVIDNLNISCIQFRSEDEDDVKQYTYDRIVREIVVEAGSECLQECQELLHISIRNIVGTLVDKRLLQVYREDYAMYNSYMLMIKRQEMATGNKSAYLLFTQAMFLTKLRDQLSTYGLSSAKQYMETQIQKNGIVKQLFYCQQPIIQFKNRIMRMGEQEASEPKLNALKEIVEEHISQNPNETMRIIIFTNLRECVHQIVESLNQQSAIITTKMFIGQTTSGTSGGKGKGMTQREQKTILKEFREGIFNTLVATCIGEEGLDIPEVGLIVCYDANASPIRNIQRIGRTGRHKEGVVVYLISKGLEEEKFYRNKEKEQRLKTSLRQAQHCFKLSKDNPRIIPPNYKPQLLEMDTSPNNDNPSQDNPVQNAQTDNSKLKKSKKQQQSNEQSSVLENSEVDNQQKSKPKNPRKRKNKQLEDNEVDDEEGQQRVIKKPRRKTRNKDDSDTENILPDPKTKQEKKSKKKAQNKKKNAVLQILDSSQQQSQNDQIQAQQTKNPKQNQRNVQGAGEKNNVAFERRTIFCNANENNETLHDENQICKDLQNQRGRVGTSFLNYNNQNNDGQNILQAQVSEFCKNSGKNDVLQDFQVRSVGKYCEEHQMDDQKRLDQSARKDSENLQKRSMSNKLFSSEKQQIQFNEKQSVITSENIILSNKENNQNIDNNINISKKFQQDYGDSIYCENFVSTGQIEQGQILNISQNLSDNFVIQQEQINSSKFQQQQEQKINVETEVRVVQEQPSQRLQDGSFKTGVDHTHSQFKCGNNCIPETPLNPKLYMCASSKLMNQFQVQGTDFDGQNYCNMVIPETPVLIDISNQNQQDDANADTNNWAGNCDGNNRIIVIDDDGDNKNDEAHIYQVVDFQKEPQQGSKAKEKSVSEVRFLCTPFGKESQYAGILDSSQLINTNTIQKKASRRVIDSITPNNNQSNIINPVQNKVNRLVINRVTPKNKQSNTTINFERKQKQKYKQKRCVFVDDVAEESQDAGDCGEDVATELEEFEDQENGFIGNDSATPEMVASRERNHAEMLAIYRQHFTTPEPQKRVVQNNIGRGDIFSVTPRDESEVYYESSFIDDDEPSPSP